MRVACSQAAFLPFVINQILLAASVLILATTLQMLSVSAPVRVIALTTYAVNLLGLGFVISSALTEALAILLISALGLSFSKIPSRPMAACVVTGVLIALLALTKAQFYYLVWLTPILALALIVATGGPWRGGLRALVITALTATVVVLPYMTRNWLRLDTMSIVTEGQGARVLAVRESYNSLEPNQYLAALTYWSPRGRALCNRLFASEVCRQLDRNQHTGFHQTGLRHYQNVVRLQQEGSLGGSPTGYFLGRFIGQLPRHAATSVLLSYRLLMGIRFTALLTVPLVVIGLWSLIRNRSLTSLAYLLPGAYSAAFIIAVTHCQTRYVAPSLPAIALLTAVGADTGLNAWKRRRQKLGAQPTT